MTKFIMINVQDKFSETYTIRAINVINIVEISPLNKDWNDKGCFSAIVVTFNTYEDQNYYSDESFESLIGRIAILCGQ